MKMYKDMGTNTDMDTDTDTDMNTPKHPPHALANSPFTISDCSCHCVKDFATNEISRNSAPRIFPGATCSTQDPRSQLIK
jgi:hypothetical protein